MDLAYKIEQKRAWMLAVAKKRNFNLIDPDVLQASQELDTLLVAALRKQVQREAVCIGFFE